jgi:hypothetical protein
VTAADFDTQFNRLTGHFHLPADASRESVALDWYRAVEHYDVNDLDHAITELIRSSKDRYWPPLGSVLRSMRGRQAGNDRGGKCPTCHGSTMIESAPFVSNGMIYANVMQRCPDCGVPPPVYTAPSNRAGLTASEYREWSQRERQPQYMPDGMQAHPWKADDETELKAGMAKLRVNLFGHLGLKGDVA